VPDFGRQSEACIGSGRAGQTRPGWARGREGKTHSGPEEVGERAVAWRSVAGQQRSGTATLRFQAIFSGMVHLRENLKLPLWSRKMSAHCSYQHIFRDSGCLQSYDVILKTFKFFEVQKLKFQVDARPECPRKHSRFIPYAFPQLLIPFSCLWDKSTRC
jgi:hypothetical protein